MKTNGVEKVERKIHFWFVLGFLFIASPLFPQVIPSCPDCNLEGFAPFKSVSGVGLDAQGAGAAVTYIDANSKPDLVLMAYDNPAGENSFRYRIGWDIDGKGNPSHWTANYIQVDGVGWEGEGAGIAFTDIDKNARPEMILMAHNQQPGKNINDFRYKVGWNLNNMGIASSWSPIKGIQGTSAYGQGAGIAMADINGNGQPDMLLMAYNNDDGANYFKYKIGWDIDVNGNIHQWTGTLYGTPIAWGNAHGADVAIADINLDNELDLVLMINDHQGKNNLFKYRIGWSVQKNGKVLSWSRWFQLKGFSNDADGAGIAYFCLPVAGQSGVNAGPRFVFMSYNGAHDDHSFRYMVLPVTTAGVCFGSADDPPPVMDDNLVIPTKDSEFLIENLCNMNMREVRLHSFAAITNFLFECAKNKDIPGKWYDFPDKKQNFYALLKHKNFTSNICPDFLVAAVSWYVAENYRYVEDDVNSFVLNDIQHLNYYREAEHIPVYYTIQYTDPAKHPTLIQQLRQKDPNWANQYNTGKRWHGDCEDYALMRHAYLRCLGFDRQFIWNAGFSGHEFNIVLYKGTYRYMDRYSINMYLCCTDRHNLLYTWNQKYPTDHVKSKQYLYYYILDRIYPDRCSPENSYILSRRNKPDIEYPDCDINCVY